MKVLIVEDNADDRKILRYNLEKHGCREIIEAGDGEEGLEMARTHRPGLIISDALMPRMDGFQFLRQLKTDDELKSIPFVFYSAVYTGYREAELALSIGADAFIVKPKEPEEFWEELQAVLEGCEISRRPPPAAVALIEEDELFLRKYSAIVAAKLEEKVAELEKSLTLRKQAEKEIGFLALIVRHIPDAVCSTDPEGKIILWNHGAEAMLGYTTEEILGRHVTLTIPEDQLPMEHEYCTTTLNRAGVFRNHESVRRAKDGRLVPVEITAIILEDEGNGTSYTYIMRDIKERKEMDRIRDEIISAVSHEMRTPLTAMLGFTEYLLENRVDEAQLKEHLRTIHQEADRLKQLITSFLALQRMKARQVVYAFSLLAVRPLLEEAALVYAKSPTHRIRVEASPDLPPIIGNEEGLRQVLHNLLSNAIKYSPRGGVVILGARREDDTVLLWVKDEGIGIPTDALDKIFTRFYQVEAGDRRSTGGTGIGLALVKAIVQAHGGRVWAESELGKGSTFKVSLPVARESRR